MMVIAVGLSSYNIALFHLVNHAFYKGLLFLGAGAVIHAWADNQDFRKYGGLRPFLPLTYSVMLIASLSLVAFPFMTGFYSKDFILESSYGQFYFSSTVVYFIATIGAMFTTLYSVKVLYLTFLTNPNGPLINYKQAHEGDIFMSLPLIVLAIFSIFFGYITKDIFIGLGSGFFADNSIFIHPLHEIMLDTEFAVPILAGLLPLFLTILFTVLSLVLSEFSPKILVSFKLSRLGYNIFSFFNQRFLIELFYNKYITGFVLKLGAQTTKVLDKGSIELVGPFGLEIGLVKLSKNLSNLDSGVITSYALYILTGLISYLLIPYLSVNFSNLLLLVLFCLLVIITSGNSLNYHNEKSVSTFHLFEEKKTKTTQSSILPFICSISDDSLNILITQFLNDLSNYYSNSLEFKNMSSNKIFYFLFEKNSKAATINNDVTNLKDFLNYHAQPYKFLSSLKPSGLEHLAQPTNSLYFAGKNFYNNIVFADIHKIFSQLYSNKAIFTSLLMPVVFMMSSIGSSSNYGSAPGPGPGGTGQPAKGNTDSPSNEKQLQATIAEIKRLLSQLKTFIDQFNNFIIANNINVITDAQGVLGIDVDESLDDSTAQTHANRINVYDNLIHNNIHSIEELIESNNVYFSQLSKYTKQLKELVSTYKHHISEDK